jgi:hypothetical protein
VLPQRTFITNKCFEIPKYFGIILFITLKLEKEAETLKAQDISDSNWRNILLSVHDYKFQFLAVQFLLTRLKQKLQKDSSPSQVTECINEIKFFFAKYENLPPVQEDLQRIMEG